MHHSKNIHARNAQAIITQAAFLINPTYELLLLQLPDGRWQLPGGKLHTQEDWRAGLLREIREETMITDVQIVRALYIDNWYTPTHDYYRSYILCTTLNNTVQLSHDHQKYKWINKKSNLAHYIFTHDTVRDHIRQFFAEV